MNFKFISAILLIISTAVGGGFMAFPAMCCNYGLVITNIILFAAWIIFLYGALWMVEINLWLPEQTHLVSMSKVCLGQIGKVVTSVFYMLLFYSLITTYFSAIDTITIDILNNYFHWDLPLGYALLFYVVIFAVITHIGFRMVSKINLWLFLGLLISFLAVVFGALPIASIKNLSVSYSQPSNYGFIGIVFAVLGYQFIIPILRDFLNSDPLKLRSAIIIASIITLLLYLIFEVTMLASMSPHELDAIASIPDATTAMAVDLSFKTQYPWYDETFLWFAYFAIFTSLLSATYSIYQFFIDAFRVQKWQVNNFVSYLVVYIPSIVLVYFYSDIFIDSLKYSGLIDVILFVIIPIVMVWQGRYRKNLSFGYQVSGGKFSLVVMMLLSLMAIIIGLAF